MCSKQKEHRRDLVSKKYLSRSYDDQVASEVFEVTLKCKKAGWQPWIKLTLVRAA
jgi:hypothetical protein